MRQGRADWGATALRRGKADWGTTAMRGLNRVK